MGASQINGSPRTLTKTETLSGLTGPAATEALGCHLLDREAAVPYLCSFGSRVQGLGLRV